MSYRAHYSVDALTDFLFCFLFIFLLSISRNNNLYNAQAVALFAKAKVERQSNTSDF